MYRHWAIALLIAASATGRADGPPCTTCDFKVSPKAEVRGKNAPCEDLYGAACQERKGSAKYHDEAIKADKSLRPAVNSARDAYAKTIGYKSIDDALKAKLKKEGLDVLDHPDAKSWMDLMLEGDDQSRSIMAPGEIFKGVKDCNTRRDQLNKVFNDEQMLQRDHTDAFRKMTEQAEAFVKSMKASVIRASAKDIAQFMSNNLKKCGDFEQNISAGNVRAIDNPTLVSRCKHIDEMKREAVYVFRAEGTPGYEKLSEKFVSEHQLPDEKYPNMAPNEASVAKSASAIANVATGVLTKKGPSQGPISPNQDTSQDPPQAPTQDSDEARATEPNVINGNPGDPAGVYKNGVPTAPYNDPNPDSKTSARTRAESGTTTEEDARDAMEDEEFKMSSLCMAYEEAVLNAARKTANEFLETAAKSKPAVEALVASVYTDDRLKKTNAIFNQARHDLQDLVQGIVTNGPQRAAITEGYDHLKFLWTTAPPESMYSKNPEGVLVLDENKIGLNSGAESLESFFDPSLSFFQTMNADYMPAMKIGTSYVSGERVNVMPEIMTLIDDHPYLVFEVIGHEEGHKIGKDMSLINGYDLSKVLDPLLDCYRSDTSIRLQPGQEDETLADYFAAELVARAASKLPPEKRTAAILSAMEGYCYFDEEKTFTFNESHPMPYLRVAGIFGANPSIRRVLGCQGEAAHFQSCGLKKSILDCPDTPLRASPASANQESVK